MLGNALLLMLTCFPTRLQAYGEVVQWQPHQITAGHPGCCVLQPSAVLRNSQSIAQLSCYINDFELVFVLELNKGVPA